MLVCAKVDECGWWVRQPTFFGKYYDQLSHLVRQWRDPKEATWSRDQVYGSTMWCINFVSLCLRVMMRVAG